MINRHYNTFRHRLENFKSQLDREEYKKDALTLQRNHQKDDVFKIDKTSSLYKERCDRFESFIRSYNYDNLVF